MNSTSLHIIQRDRLFEGIILSVSYEMENRPSNYISHETFACKVDGELWAVSSLNLRGELSVVPPDILDDMKRKEGMSSFGKSPDLTDDRGRIVYCFTRMNQLLINHLLPSKGLRKDSLVGIRCLQVRNHIVPLDAGVTPLKAKSSSDTVDTSDKPRIPEDFVDVKEEDTIEVELLATYKPPKQYELISSGNMVKSGSSLKDFVKLDLKQTETFFCTCQGDISMNHITIVLEEHLRYQHIASKEGCVSEEVRTVVLKDSSINNFISHSDFKEFGTGFLHSPNVSLYDCSLPNIGPTYSSNKCTRSYALRFNIDLECGLGKCSKHISTVMDIAVATQVHSAQPVFQVQKKQDVMLLETFELDSYLAQNAIQYCSQRQEEMELDCISYHLSSVVEDEKALVIATLHTTNFYDFQEEQKVNEIESNEGLALFPKNGSWTVNEALLTTSNAGIPGRMFEVSRFVNVFDEFSFSNDYGSKDDRFSFSCDYRKALMAGPGMTLDPSIAFRFTSSYHPVMIYFDNLEVILGQQTVGFNKTCREAFHKEYELHSKNGKRLSFREVEDNGQKDFIFEGLLEGCEIPNVMPSTLSDCYHKGYKLNLSIEAHGVAVGSGGYLERIDCKLSESIDILMDINECYRLMTKEGHVKTYIS
ncbi:uncharacterized protein CXQ87_004435 [Candidozyma duobushaemuli]|uniref:Uncharacterized protein n=2 Tax=Candidozyma TaxID=3303203 RepID=A0ABX8IFP7_9ASCO|nr:uncharacterized protein CXQ87_004435 [[Candida] duobushaemulonis]PVH16878.1 hypothetical protein CXQ87_004435 [[Candida] duobushaemulonis]QWU89666.1 hypothetical protein CA3LBN_004014 [[Candida] haemuloni]